MFAPATKMKNGSMLSAFSVPLFAQAVLHKYPSRKFSPFIVVVSDIFGISQVAPLAARKILVKNFSGPKFLGVISNLPRFSLQDRRWRHFFRCGKSEVSARAGFQKVFLLCQSHQDTQTMRNLSSFCPPKAQSLLPWSRSNAKPIPLRFQIRRGSSLFPLNLQTEKESAAP